MDLSPIRRGLASLAGRGLAGSADQLWTIALDYWFDYRWGIETLRDVRLSSLLIESENRAAGNGYKATRLRPFQAALGELKLDRDCGFVDFGSGKGKVLLLAAQAGFERSTGVEFSEELCVIARRNIERYRSKTPSGASISVVHGDAGEYPIQSEDRVFYFFFPFQEPVMARIVDRIEASLDRFPRRIHVVYNNPQCRNVLDRRKRFRLALERDYWGSVFVAYVAER